jgi:hypothetical protein
VVIVPPYALTVSAVIELGFVEYFTSWTPTGKQPVGRPRSMLSERWQKMHYAGTTLFCVSSWLNDRLKRRQQSGSMTVS